MNSNDANVLIIFQKAWDLFKDAMVTYVLAGLVVSLGTLLSFGVMMGPLVVGFFRMVDRHRRGEAIELGQVLGGMDSFGSAFLTSLMMFVGIALGGTVFVLPGLAVALFSSYALLFVALEKSGTVDALKASAGLVAKDFVTHLFIFLVLWGSVLLGSALVVTHVVFLPLGLIFHTLVFKEFEPGA